jgi:hypothetical protein
MLSPPGTLIAFSVEFTMMQPTDWDGEPVADFASHRPMFRELDVVEIGRRSAAEEARLSGHKSRMVAIAFRHGFAEDIDLL